MIETQSRSCGGWFQSRIPTGFASEPPLAGFASRSRCPPDSGGQYPSSQWSRLKRFKSRPLESRNFPSIAGRAE